MHLGLHSELEEQEDKHMIDSRETLRWRDTFSFEPRFLLNSAVVFLS